MKKNMATNMTEGSPYKLILMFSLPMLLGNVFQQLYNMVDSVVVGNFVGEKALAAVGTGFPVIFMMSALFMGIGMGATVMISQYYGAGDHASIQKTVSTIYTAILFGIIPLTILGVVISRPLLVLMKVPDDGTLDMAVTYMQVVFVGIIGALGFNINAGILQGLGDSKTSLLFLMVASIINIVLDLVFTVGMGMGVAGVALATIIAQFVSWVFGIFYINKRYDFIKIRLFKFHFEKELFFEAMRLGIPAGIQQALFSVGMMVMQSLVNSYGSSFMAGFNGANKIDSFAFMPIQSFANAVTTYVGQNVGAGRMDRVKKGTRAGCVLSVGCSIIIGAGLFPFAGGLMRMFSPNPEVIAAGELYLHTVLPFYSLLALNFIFSAVLRGAGNAIVPLICSVISLWLARVPTAFLLANLFGRDSIYFSYMIGWLLGGSIAFIYYCTGRWKRNRLKMNISESEEEPE